MLILLIAFIALVCFAVFMLARNTLVFDERMRVLEIVSRRAAEDRAAGLNGLWRYTALAAVNYDRMMLQFWRPVSSFYRDAACLKSWQQLKSNEEFARINQILDELMNVRPVDAIDDDEAA